MEKTATQLLNERQDEKRNEKRQEKYLIEQTLSEERKARAIKSLNFLLKKSLSFSSFFKGKLDEIQQASNGKNSKNDTESLQDIAEEEPTTEDNSTSALHLTYFEGGTLKPYQVEGVTWLKLLYENGINGILADEMGLGKTIEVIALLSHLYEMQVPGPYLIVVPLSTLMNWESEFKKFAPQIPVFVFYGYKLERVELAQEYARKCFYLNKQRVKPVVLTSYDTPFYEPLFFKRLSWQYVIIDEGHRIKNHNSKLAKLMRELKSINRLLLTGTPIQNNLTELWALLNFLLPHIFGDVQTFASLCLMEQVNSDGINQECRDIVDTIHKVLAPFILRRKKKDVLIDLVPKKEIMLYCPLTKLQLDLYKFTIERDINGLLGKDEDADNLIVNTKRIKKQTSFYRDSVLTDYIEDDNIPTVEMKLEENDIKTAEKLNIEPTSQKYLYHLTMQNRMAMFKKIVNHPYLVHFPLDPNSAEQKLLIDENIVQESGKMLVLDAMLTKLKQRDHKVLLFSTMTMILDLIEELIIMRGYSYCRLDGTVGLADRDDRITRFNNDENIFIFLISTRAGGLGLNLTSADTVILFDSDWNPQVDIQAQDRCHRIGQTKPVMVYTLVTKNTIDERIVVVANMKRRLEKAVIKDTTVTSLKDLQDMKTLLDSTDCTLKVHSNGFVYSEAELDEYLDRSDLYKKMNENCTAFN